MRWCVFILAALVSSCSPTLRNLSVEQVQMGEGQRVELTLTNSSSKEVKIQGAKIVANINGEPLISATLKEGFDIGAECRVTLSSEWEVEKHDPATLYALQRRALESYIERITFDYSLTIVGQKTISRRGVKGKKLLRRVENIEKLLQQ